MIAPSTRTPFGSLGELVARVAELLAPEESPLPAGIARALGVLGAAPKGTVYLEHRLSPAAPGVDAIVHVEPRDLADQCERMAASCADAAAAASWRALGATAGAHPAAMPHHYWLELDRDAQGEQPNVFLCHVETREQTPDDDGFRAAVARAEDALALDPGHASALLDAVRRLLPASGFVSYAGLMLARTRDAARLCVTGLDVDEALALVGSLACDDGRAAAVGDTVRRAGLVGPTLLHLDGTAERVTRVGLEIPALAHTGLAGQSPAFAAVHRQLDADDTTAAWLERATAGGGAYTRAGERWLAVTRRLNHVKVAMSADDAVPAWKAYVRYDWRRASAVMNVG